MFILTQNKEKIIYADKSTTFYIRKSQSRKSKYYVCAYDTIEEEAYVIASYNRKYRAEYLMSCLANSLSRNKEYFNVRLEQLD